ncbi:MAG: Na+:solute symporter [Bacteroidia bacterium]|nr:Na+:solute symporter [Bacteroidia bacterium]
MATLQTLDYIAMIIYMLIMAGMGLFLGFFIKNVGDYFKGGNTIPWYVGGISNFMSLFSTFVFVAYAGIAYEHGLVAVTIIWCAVPATLIGALVFSKLWRRAGINSPVEFLETRYNASIRQVFSWGGVGFRVLDNMVRLYAIGVFVATATPLSLETAILVAGIIVVLYTVVGGLWAVVLTDVVQFLVLITAALILVPLSLNAVGGWQSLVLNQPQHFGFFNGPKGHLSFLVVYYLMFIIKNNGNWAFIQRFYSVKDEKAGLKMGLLTAALFFIFPIFFLIPAITSASLLPNLENVEMAYVAVALQLLPEGIMGIMLAAMFAATMSSLDSEYNVMANVITTDIYQRRFRPRANASELMIVARITTFIVGALIMVGALFVDKFGGAFEASKLFTSLFAIPLIIPVIFGILLPWPNAWGAGWSLVTGVLTGLVLNYLPQVSWELATFITMMVCLGSFLVSSFMPRRNLEKQRQIEEFFHRLREPVPTSEKPTIEPGFKRAVCWLVIFSLNGVGVLFAMMSLPSIEALSGQLALGAGITCLLGAGILYLTMPKRRIKSREYPDSDPTNQEVVSPQSTVDSPRKGADR